MHYNKNLAQKTDRTGLSFHMVLLMMKADFVFLFLKMIYKRQAKI